MNSYELSRNWFNYCFGNPEKIKPNHSALYFFAIEHCNRLGWKEKFGFPSQMVMEALGIRSWKTYIKTLNELEEFGFIEILERSKNQYSSNIIALVKNTKAHTKALDKALQKHSQKQVRSIASIIKQYNKEQLTSLKEEIDIMLLKFDSSENNIYTVELFLEDWNKLRFEILKKPSHVKRLSSNESREHFKEINNAYTREEINNAMLGLFKQQIMPKGIDTLRTTPVHFLKEFERYLQAYNDKNKYLYGDKKE